MMGKLLRTLGVNNAEPGGNDMSDKMKLDVAKLDSAILTKIHGEIGRHGGLGTAAAFDTHIKGVCDIHGKGSHIKGAGPNYLKETDLEAGHPEFGDVLKNYDALVTRLAADVAAKIKATGQ